MNSRVDLSRMPYRGYTPGKPFWFRALWLAVEAITLLNPLFVPVAPKRAILRAFGATIGPNVNIKPNVHVKYPWLLTVGENAWLGERCWIDNFVAVSIGNNACISQGSYLCTGNHDWKEPTMALMVKPIAIESGAWVGAFARIGPGVTVGQEAIVTMGSVLLRNAEPNGIYQGNPAILIKNRILNA